MSETAPHLLVVGQDLRLTESLCETFGVKGYLTSRADSARTALELIRPDRYEAVILDSGGPELGNLRFVAKLKNLDPHLEVVVLADQDQPDISRLALQFGAFESLLKPYRFEWLLEVVSQALLHRHITLFEENRRPQLAKIVVGQISELRHTLEARRRLRSLRERGEGSAMAKAVDPYRRIADLEAAEAERRRTAEVLLESEAAWRHLAESTCESMAMVDHRMQIQLVNRAAPPFHQPDAAGKNIFEFLFPEYHIMARRNIEQAFRDGVCVRFETQGIGAGGFSCWFEISAGPIMVKGQVASVALMVRDITRSRRAEERADWHHHLLEQFPETILIHNPYQICYVNNEGVRLFGASKRNDLVGRPVIDLVPPDHREHFERRVQRVFEHRQKAEFVNEKLLRLDGRIISVWSTLTPITYEGEPAAQNVLRQPPDVN